MGIKRWGPKGKSWNRENTLPTDVKVKEIVGMYTYDCLTYLQLRTTRRSEKSNLNCQTFALLLGEKDVRRKRTRKRNVYQQHRSKIR